MPPPRRLQISLGNFLLVMALVAVSASHIITSYRYWQDEKTFENLRRQHGYLKIENPARIQALTVQAIEPQTWKWQLYLPPGRNYRFHIATKELPREGLPAKSDAQFEVHGDPEPQPLTIAVRVDDRDRCLAILLRPQFNGRWVVADERASWIRQPEQYRVDVVTAAFTAANRKDSYELFRLRTRKRPTEPGVTRPQEFEDGLMVWVEPL